MSKDTTKNLVGQPKRKEKLYAFDWFTIVTNRGENTNSSRTIGIYAPIPSLTAFVVVLVPLYHCIAVLWSVVVAIKPCCPVASNQKIIPPW